MAGEIFISYRRSDQAWARLLHAQLKAEGVEAWYDAHIAPGDDWRIATARALEDSRIFVLLFSANAAQSGDIAKELAAATLENKLIIPVRLENIAPKGAFLYELASRNWVNAFVDTEAKLAELAKGLAHLVKTGGRDESVLPFDRSRAAQSLVRRWRSISIISAVATAAIVAAITAAFLLWPRPHWTVESSRAFISTLVPEDYPAFSPDGKTLAYTSDSPGARKIYVRNLAGGDGLKVTSDAYDDVSPSWSSDGARIAYVALKSGEPCRIMVVTVPAGQPREAGRCAEFGASKVTWQPGTPFLYYIDRVTPFATAIFRLDLDSGSRLEITGGKTGDYFDDLRCSPDGKSLVYLKNSLTADGIFKRDIAGGKETFLGRVTKSVSTQWPASATWSEDSRTVFVTASGGSEITAYPADGGPAYRVYTTAAAAGHLAAGPGGLLAFEVDASRTNLARARPSPNAQPDILDAANGISFSPSFAPDGTLAFLSNRSGSNAVWTMKPGASASILFDAGASPLFLADFSPDGSRLVVVYGSLNGVTYRILTADGANVATFEMPDIAHGQPTWTPDSKALISTDAGGNHAVSISIDKPSQQSAFSPPPWEAVAVHGNGTFAVRHDKPNTLWRIDKEPVLVSNRYDDHGWPPMTFRGDDVLIPDFSAEGGARILAQPLGGGADRVLAYAPDAENKGFLGKMAVEPKTGSVIYAASVVRDTNINLLTLSRH